MSFFSCSRVFSSGELTTNSNLYDLTEKILDKKSHFASSVLFLALTDKSCTWKVPQYIKDGLNWISE